MANRLGLILVFVLAAVAGPATAAATVDVDYLPATSNGFAPAIYNLPGVPGTGTSQWVGAFTQIQTGGALVQVDLPLLRDNEGIVDDLALVITRWNGAGVIGDVLLTTRFSAADLPAFGFAGGIFGHAVAPTSVSLGAGVQVETGDFIGMLLTRAGGQNLVSDWVVWLQNPAVRTGREDVISTDSGATWSASDPGPGNLGYRPGSTPEARSPPPGD